MEGLTTGHSILHALSGAAWEARRAARRFSRRWGWSGWAVLLMLAVTTCALLVARQQGARAAAHAARLAVRAAATAPAAGVPVAASDAGQAGARARLQAFSAQLLPHADIPFALQSLLELGAAEGLSMQRGSYRPRVDAAGRFMRYSLSLPVKGPAPAIERFLIAALHQQGNLALDSVQFKRGRIGSADIEARIEWVLLTTLPPTGSAGEAP